MIRGVLVLFLLIISLVSCTKETGCGSGDWMTSLGPFELQPESLEMFPYEKGITGIAFKDPQVRDRLHWFNVEEDTLRNYPALFNSQCTVDPKYYPLYSTKEEYRIFDFENQFHTLRFKVQLYAGLNRDFADQSKVADYLSIELGTIYTKDGVKRWQFEEVLKLVIDPRTDPDAESNFTNFYPELTLNDRAFTDVYEKIMDDPDRPRRIYFNFEWGLIGFTNSKGEYIYSFDQVMR